MPCASSDERSRSTPQKAKAGDPLSSIPERQKHLFIYRSLRRYGRFSPCDATARGGVASFPASGIAGLKRPMRPTSERSSPETSPRSEPTKYPNTTFFAPGSPAKPSTLAGQRRGIEDTRGTLFFDIARTLKAKRPAVFFLENLKGLMSHRGGQTLAAILCALRDELAYFVPTPQVIKAEDHGVPQKRGHVFPVEFHSDLNINRFNYTSPSKV